MFGDIFGNLEEKQAQLKEKLAEIQLESSSGEGKVSIKMNAAKEIKSINISKELLHPEHVEELEDHLIAALESILSEVTEKEQEASKKMIQDMIPGFGGGLPDLGNLFK